MCFHTFALFLTENDAMQIPTVKSFCCFELKTIGLVFGFLQLLIYVLVMLVNLCLRGFLFIPMIMMSVALSVGWIYGILEVCVEKMCFFVFFLSNNSLTLLIFQ